MTFEPPATAAPQEHPLAHGPQQDADRRVQLFAMSLSLLVGLAMFAIKVGAYALTGSAVILGDAAESVVHVAAVVFAFCSLRLSYRPADPSHLYGHAKISFFSAGFEGAMIVLAAAFIIFEAIRKWVTGLELENLGLGTSLTVLAMMINGALGAYLIWTGKRRKSVILEANGKHVLTDFWTSLGAVCGLSLALLTGYLAWDPIAAIVVALNILWSGIGLMRQSISGLMDVADPQLHPQIVELLDRQTHSHGITYHNLRHRHMGDAYWIEVHLLFPGSMPIREAHRIATRIENAVADALDPHSYVTTHLESIEDHDRVHSQESL